jgi:hypothetical protein
MKEFLTVHIKLLKSNFFLIISTNSGQVLLNTSSGSLGFKNIQKRSLAAFDKILSFGIEFTSCYPNNNYIFFKFENVKKVKLYKLYKAFFKKLKKRFIGFEISNKIPHNNSKK